MTLIITNAGLEKATTAGEQGVNIKLTHVGVGLNGYEAEKEQVALQNEITRIEIQGGKKVSANQVHLTALFDGEEEINGREIGFYLEDGTLFAIESDPVNIIIYKSGSKGSTTLESFDLVLDSIPPDSITVDVTGDLGISFTRTFKVMAVAQINNMRRTLINMKKGQVNDNR